MNVRRIQVFVVAGFLVSCQSTPESLLQHEVDYKTFHEVQCQNERTDICVEIGVSIDEQTLGELVNIASSTLQHHRKIVGIRVDKHRPKPSGSDIILVVGGYYDYVRNEPCCGSEEVVAFVLRNGAWEVDDTYEILYDPS